MGTFCRITFEPTIQLSAISAWYPNLTWNTHTKHNSSKENFHHTKTSPLSKQLGLSLWILIHPPLLLKATSDIITGLFQILYWNFHPYHLRRSLFLPKSFIKYWQTSPFWNIEIFVIHVHAISSDSLLSSVN